MFRLRLLPAVIVCALVVLGFKLDGLRRDWGGFAVNTAWAEAGEKETASKQDDPSKPASNTESMKAEADAKPADGEAKEMASGDGGAKAEPTDKPKQLLSGRISKGELEVLQSLANRREMLEKRSEELQLRENLMAATEKRVEEKIAKLKALETQIKKLLRQHDKERDEQLNSLVKVYEKMKPKDAARIFEQLEMDILLQVTGRMKEGKMAPVLAAMDPEKAKELTVKLATQRKLPETGEGES